MQSEIRMKFDIPAAPMQILRLLNEAGYEAYLVGGCVRDAMRGDRPHDYDITTSALPEEILQMICSFLSIVKSSPFAVGAVFSSSAGSVLFGGSRADQFIEHRLIFPR